MRGKIAVEEHFAIEQTLGGAMNHKSSEAMRIMQSQLCDFGGERIQRMDAAGIERMVLSLNMPAIQAMPEPSVALQTAVIANDVLAEAVARTPGRFSGIAALPMQDPDTAIKELRRSIRELKLSGVLVNGYSITEDGAPIYYDLPQYEPFWQELQALDVPFYLHTRDPLPDQQKAYDGHPWLLGAAWGFAAETSLHAARLMSSGLFDRYPRLQVVLGHLGEGLPYAIWRLEHRVKKSPRGIPARKPLGDYLRENFHVSVSGNFSTRALAAAISEMGAERVLFAVDYPFEDMDEAANWFDSLVLDEQTRRLIERDNAIQLFKLDESR